MFDTSFVECSKFVEMKVHTLSDTKYLCTATCTLYIVHCTTSGLVGIIPITYNSTHPLLWVEPPFTYSMAHSTYGPPGTEPILGLPSNNS